MITSVPVASQLLETIREENLNVYRASSQRLREDVSQENQIARDYRGRLIYELLQNADDAMASDDAGVARIRFLLTDDALWVGNSGRPLDEADVRGLCGISASSKVGVTGQRRATNGHKGMGFKSVLEITNAPEVYSTTISFRFGPDEALRAVHSLGTAHEMASVTRAPVTRFPWPIEQIPAEWAEMRAAGMRTAFRFPLAARVSAEQRAWLAQTLIDLPVTTLLFLKRFRRVEFIVCRANQRIEKAWTVTRETLPDVGRSDSDDSGSEIYRVLLRPDSGEPQEFLLAHDADIPIGDHRGGLDEFAWEGVEYTEVSVGARLASGRPVSLPPDWRVVHVFLPSGEPCPYNLLVSGAFSSNLSRQEIRIEPDAWNYNRFLLRQVARLLRDHLIPILLAKGAQVADVLCLLDRGPQPDSLAGSGTGAALYEAVRAALLDFSFIPQEDGPPLAPKLCIFPPLVANLDVGRDFRAVLPTHASLEGYFFPEINLCGADSARILIDHGARAANPEEVAAVLAAADEERSRAREDVDRGVYVDPVLSILERLWDGLAPRGRAQLASAVRCYPLCPVSIKHAEGPEHRKVHRIVTQTLECFYPPRSLGGEVPLDGLCFLARDICWGLYLNPKERNSMLRPQMEAWQGLFSIREFKFPDVMRASVLPALELERSDQSEHSRVALRRLERLAAICQLAGRTPNRRAPLPYERLGANRALFNLSRLDVPCRKYGDDSTSQHGDDIVWMPAYRVYFGDNWVGKGSIEWVLLDVEEIGAPLPDIYVLLDPGRFSGLLDRYRYLKGTADQIDPEEDEVSLDEDEETALGADDRTLWFEFFSWLGVNASLRPVHFHDVEGRAAGWLRTEQL